jgi:hypothetical protein
MKKNLFFVEIFKAIHKKGHESVTQWYGFADPDLRQNVTDPQYCFTQVFAFRFSKQFCTWNWFNKQASAKVRRPKPVLG